MFRDSYSAWLHGFVRLILFMKTLLKFGKPCTTDEWLKSPERVLKHLTTPATAKEVNRRRWGSYVPVSVDVEELKACKRHGLVSYDRKTGVWSLLPNTRIDQQ